MTLSLLHGLKEAPLCKVSGSVALMASGRSYLCAFSHEGPGRDPEHKGLLGRHGFPWLHVPGVLLAHTVSDTSARTQSSAPGGLAEPVTCR